MSLHRPGWVPQIVLTLLFVSMPVFDLQLLPVDAAKVLAGEEQAAAACAAD